MGRDMGHGREFSESMAERVDGQVRALIEQAHNEAYQVINDNRDVLDRLALELLEKETLDHNQLAEIFKDVRRLDPRPVWLSNDERPVSNRPPIEVPASASTDAARLASDDAPVAPTDNADSSPAAPPAASPDPAGS